MINFHFEISLEMNTEGVLSTVILLHEKFVLFVWLRVVVFQLNSKYLNVKITVSMALQKMSHVGV